MYQLGKGQINDEGNYVVTLYVKPEIYHLGYANGDKISLAYFHKLLLGTLCV